MYINTHLAEKETFLGNAQTLDGMIAESFTDNKMVVYGLEMWSGVWLDQMKYTQAMRHDVFAQLKKHGYYETAG